MKKLFLFFIFFTQQVYVAPAITIFVHGSQNATKWLSKDIWYCQQGLHHINELPQSSCFVQDAHALEKANNQLFTTDEYYTFGWSGLVNFAVREQAGKRLFDELQLLLQKYKKQYRVDPVVRIITHSHGGNIVLNMLKHISLEEKISMELELIILACPVQKVTESLIEHPAIARSYVIYSTRDRIQCLDFYWYQGWYRLPRRIFCTHSKNCVQILVRVNGHALTHTDFAHSFIRHIPEVIVASQDAYGLIDYNIIDPGFMFYNGFNITAAMQGKRKRTASNLVCI